MALQNLLFLAVLALLPVQLNKFIFIDSSHVLGIPIDYRALSLYLSDIAIILYIAVFFAGSFNKLPRAKARGIFFLARFGSHPRFVLQRRIRLWRKNRGFLAQNKVKSFFTQNKKLTISLIFFNLYLIANNLFREGFPITLYFSVRILILSLFFIAAQQTIGNPKINKYIYRVISISLIWQSALIIFQFIFQRSQGFWYLGERSFDSSTVSIAHIDIFGIQLLRSYGTFPHPNLAGAFLTLGLIFLYLSKNPKKNTFNIAASILAIIALGLTFSRSAVTVFSLLILILSNNLKSLILKSVVLFSLVIILLPLLINTQLASLAERLTLTQTSLDIAGKNLLTGVGNTNFLTQLAKLDLTSLAQTRLIQPVHNVFLLVLSENGIIGFTLFIVFLYFVSQCALSKTKIMLFVAILIFATVDHFLWTLHQGQMLFWLSLAFVVSKPHQA